MTRPDHLAVPHPPSSIKASSSKDPPTETESLRLISHKPVLAKSQEALTWDHVQSLMAKIQEMQEQLTGKAIGRGVLAGVLFSQQRTMHAG